MNTKHKKPQWNTVELGFLKIKPGFLWTLILRDHSGIFIPVHV